MIEQEMNQICKKCGKDKPLVEFNETSDRSVITHITTCKLCQSEYNAEYYKANKQRVKDNKEYNRKKAHRCDKNDHRLDFNRLTNLNIKL